MYVYVYLKVKKKLVLYVKGFIMRCMLVFFLIYYYEVMIIVR